MNSPENFESQEKSPEQISDEEKVREIFGWIIKKATELLAQQQESIKIHDHARETLGQLDRLGGDRGHIERSTLEGAKELVGKLKQQLENLDRGLGEVNFGCAITALRIISRKYQDAQAEDYLREIIRIGDELKQEGR